MDILSAGKDQSQADQPNSLAEVGTVEQTEQPNYLAEGQTPFERPVINNYTVGMLANLSQLGPMASRTKEHITNCCQLATVTMVDMFGTHMHECHAQVPGHENAGSESRTRAWARVGHQELKAQL
eukprot:1159003-Pelagomonas_calceolata.AAC.6